MFPPARNPLSDGKASRRLALAEGVLREPAAAETDAALPVYIVKVAGRPQPGSVRRRTSPGRETVRRSQKMSHPERSGLRGRPGAGIAVVVAVLVFLARPGAVRSQPSCLASGPSVTMEMLLEKTLFQVDVLELSVRVGGEAAERLRALAREGDASSERADSVARIAAGATCAGAQLDFVRDVSLDRFLDAVRESSRAAREAGLIEPETYALIDRSLPEWYAFLEGRGVREGDRMTYGIRGDTLDIRYRGSEGELLLDRTDVDAARRRSVLAGYFARGSDFREGLVDSLFREERSSGDDGPNGSVPP